MQLSTPPPTPNPAAPVMPSTQTVPPTKAQDHYHLRYGIVWCDLCNLDVTFCKGHIPPGAPAKDGAESGLAKRIADCHTSR